MKDIIDQLIAKTSKIHQVTIWKIAEGMEPQRQDISEIVNVTNSLNQTIKNNAPARNSGA